MRQYVQVKLSSKSDRLYTYLNDQPADVQDGDSVEIELPSGERRIVVAEVVSADRPSSCPSHVNLKQCYKAG